ncbi:MAG: FCD domain-containing protein, partial [Nitriliruptoraceae bacterium]
PLLVAAARAAAQRAGSDDLDRIDAARTEMEHAILVNEALGVEADAKFHHAIAQAAHNQVLEMVDRALQPLYGKAREVGLSKPGRPTQVIDEHRAIVEAIRSGEADAAEVAMCRHLGPLAEDAIDRLTTTANAITLRNGHSPEGG